jgi:hypothetical protein
VTAISTSRQALDLGIRCQDHGHCFGMDRANFGIRIRGEKSEKLMLALDRICLGAALTVPGGPDTREQRQRPVLTKRKPCRRLARLGVGVFTKRSERHEATAFRFEPAPPVRAFHVANIGDRSAAEGRRSGHPPSRHHQFTHAVRRIAHDGRGIVRKNSRHGRKVAGAVAHGANNRNNRCLTFCE